MPTNAIIALERVEELGGRAERHSQRYGATIAKNGRGTMSMPANRYTGAAAIGALMLMSVAVAGAQAATLIVVNQTNQYVTVSVDGGYGCNTAGHTSCTIPVSAGDHNLSARTARGATTSAPNAYIPPEGRTWTISPGP